MGEDHNASEIRYPHVSSSIPVERIRLLPKAEVSSVTSGQYVLYWMHASARTEENPALQCALERANHLHLPCLVYVGLWKEYPEANLRHFWFMLEGLREVSSDLESRGIRLILRIEPPDQGFLALARKAAIAILDRAYLHVHRLWYRRIADKCPCPVLQVEGNVIVPVELASQKEEYSAATFRPRIRKQMDRFLQLLPPLDPERSSLAMDIPTLSGMSIGEILSQLKPDSSVPRSPYFVGGSLRARHLFAQFLDGDLSRYADSRQDPGDPVASSMSPYLHFGQISPVTLALGAQEVGGPGAEAFLEELLVRRELGINFVHFNPHYDTFASLPSWAQQTLHRHASDPRPYLYTLPELEAAQTHDPYWNAAQQEMVSSGKMHSYLRMYWGKKILEWSPSPEEAYHRALYLNNRYELDGRDPGGYAGVAWCFGKHDRPWKERPILGTVRYMSAEGLQRKFDIGAYVHRQDERRSPTPSP